MSDKPKSPQSKSSEITPESTYLNRRNFLKTSIYAGTLAGTAGLYRIFRNAPGETSEADLTPEQEKQFVGPNGEPATSFQDISNYNNYYEFTTDKEGVASRASKWNITDWNLEIGGLVANPGAYDLDQLRQLGTEDRVYRFRCVEGWSMVIPWQGFSLASLLRKAEPLSQAKYVAFTTYFDPKDMPAARYSGLPFPYVEALRLDEAMNPLTFLATGLYGKNLPQQNGAPVRLVVPWKYGFKSIKSVVKIELTAHQPPTTWNLVAPNEYGFYSNVNPEVDHPRWSQAKERRIGEYGMIPTLMFNGYGDDVAQMYAGLDLKRNF